LKREKLYPAFETPFCYISLGGGIYPLFVFFGVVWVGSMALGFLSMFVALFGVFFFIALRGFSAFKRDVESKRQRRGKRSHGRER
jgi:hypothetical protein